MSTKINAISFSNKTSKDLKFTYNPHPLHVQSWTSLLHGKASRNVSRRIPTHSVY